MTMEKKEKVVLQAVILFFSVAVMGRTADDLRTVSGVAKDASGAPLPGLSVSIRNAARGTQTHTDGYYSLEVFDTDTLQFSYLGMVSQRIAVGNQKTINVVMEEYDEEKEIAKGIADGTIVEPAKRILLTSAQRKILEADNQFAFKLFDEVSKINGDNTFFSPFSLQIALGMLYNGVTGNTRSEMVKALGIAEFSETEINEYYQVIIRELLTVDPTTELNIANSIWLRHTFQVKNTFTEIGKKYFDAEIQAIDFNNPLTANRINQWCADKTKNRITQIVSNPIPDDMWMMLINALYFKSKWEKGREFKKEKTILDDFTKENQQKIKVNLMEQTASLPYYEDDYLQCVEITYGNKAFSLIAFLPAENRTINQLIKHLTTIKWKMITDRLREEKVWLKLPRFKFECSFLLNQPVINTGMKRVFNVSKDFAPITDDILNVSNIVQKTFVEVNEEGTEAAAVSAIRIVGYGVRKADDPVRFFADRPFLFLIREKSTGVILFIGRVDEPR